MKFYDRESELQQLRTADALKSKHSIMTMLIGRRRVGKTTLSLQNFSNDKKVYLFVSKKDEHLLCREFSEELSEQLGVKLFGEIKSFEKLFEYIMELGRNMSFTLIIDEFQELGKINPSIYSSIQKIWDLNKNNTHIHFIACGSIYSLMKKIYEDKSEPLFGRIDFMIDLKPFTVRTLKDILEDNGRYSAEHLLDFYTITGGVAKYIELFELHNAFEFEEMLDVMIRPNSIFLQEGKNRLIEEFGKEYSIYFSILSLIASSKTSRSEIESILERNISGHLMRLEKDYSIIKAIKPIDAKPNSKVQKYEIVDNFLSFWFRFIFKYQSVIEAESFDRLKDIIRRDFSTFKGRFLEKLFMDIFRQEQIYTKIGSYWEKGNKNEIDIVAIDDLDKSIAICETKLNPKKLNKNELIIKSQKLLKKYDGYKAKYLLLSTENIDDFIA